MGKNTNYSERLIQIVPHFMSLIVLYFNKPPLYHDLKQGLNPTVDKYRIIDKP